MARLGIGWKEAGCDTSPPRPEPTDEKREKELATGARFGRIHGWIEQGSVVHDATRDAYIARKVGYIIGAGDIMDDVEFARFALSVKAGG